MWDADKIQVAALLKKDGKSAGTLTLQYAGSPSRFSGTWSVPGEGIYDAVVYAYDPSNGNTGIGRAVFSVKP